MRSTFVFLRKSKTDFVQWVCLVLRLLFRNIVNTVKLFQIAKFAVNSTNTAFYKTYYPLVPLQFGSAVLQKSLRGKNIRLFLPY